MEHTNFHSKYDLAFCELFNRKIHGINNTSSKNIDYYYLIHTTVPIYTFYDPIIFDEIITYVDEIKFCYELIYYDRPLIQNYNYIINKNSVPFDIVECIELDGGEYIAIFKTFWLRIFQRMWKKRFALKKQRVSKLLQPYGLMLREIGITNNNKLSLSIKHRF